MKRGNICVVALLTSVLMTMTACGGDAGTAASQPSSVTTEAASETVASSPGQAETKEEDAEENNATEAGTQEETPAEETAKDPNGLEFAKEYTFEEFAEYSGGNVYRDEENGWVITTGDFYIENGEGFLNLLVAGHDQIKTMTIPVNLDQEKAQPVLGQGGTTPADSPDTEFTGVTRVAETEEGKVKITFGKGFFGNGQSAIDILVDDSGIIEGSLIHLWGQSIPVTLE